MNSDNNIIAASNRQLPTAVFVRGRGRGLGACTRRQRGSDLRRVERWMSRRWCYLGCWNWADEVPHLGTASTPLDHLHKHTQVSITTEKNSEQIY